MPLSRGENTSEHHLMHFRFWVLEKKLRHNLESKVFVRDQHCKGQGAGRLSRGGNERVSQDQQTLRELGEGFGTNVAQGIMSIRLTGLLCQRSVNFDQPAMLPVSL